MENPSELQQQVVRELAALWSGNKTRYNMLRIHLDHLDVRGVGDRRIKDLLNVVFSDLDKYGKRLYSAESELEFEQYLLGRMSAIRCFADEGEEFRKPSEIERHRMLQELTISQRSAIVSLTALWSSPVVPESIFSLLRQIREETVGGNEICDFLQDVLTNLLYRKLDVFPVHSCEGFELYLIERTHVIAMRTGNMRIEHSPPSFEVKSLALSRMSHPARETRCWRCKNPLNSRRDPECPKCHTILCECGACLHSCHM